MSDLALDNFKSELNYYAVELISSTNALLELSAIMASKVGRKALDVSSSLKILASNGVNLSEVNNYAIKNAKKLLDEHNLQKAIASRVFSRLKRAIKMHLLASEHCKLQLTRHSEFHEIFKLFS